MDCGGSIAGFSLDPGSAAFAACRSICDYPEYNPNDCGQRYFGYFASLKILTIVSNAISLFKMIWMPKSQNNACGHRYNLCCRILSQITTLTIVTMGRRSEVDGS
jgi:hypothetical protein